MNQSQLRPPKRVYQGACAWLGIPAVLYLVFVLWWFPRLGELQRVYLTSYVKETVTPEFHLGRGRHPEDRTLYCALDERGQESPAIEGMKDLRGLHTVKFSMTGAEYQEWLQRFIYRKTVWAFCLPPVLWSAEVLTVLFLLAWNLDRRRHFRFRSTPRHIRGSQLLTRSDFRRKVKGERSGWFARQLASKVRPEGLGWRTEDFEEEV